MDLQQLIKEAAPGSVWMRTDGSRARVIAITNLSLPADSQQKYVPVVVYVGPSGKVFSRPLKDFAGYFPTWLSHDTSAEKAINSLLVPLNAPRPLPTLTEEDDEIDMSLDEPVAAPREKPAVQVREKPTLARVAETGSYHDLVNTPAPPPVVLKGAFKISSDPSRKTPLIDADKLSRALRVYSQVPDEHLGLVVHKLSFELSPSLGIEDLKEVFAPDEWVNTVDMFRIGTPVHDETVGVDAYIGVYPEFTRNVLYGTVYVGVDMVPVAPYQDHVHEEVLQAETTAPDVPVQDGSEVPTVDAERYTQPEAIEVPAPAAVEEVSAEVPNDQATPAASEAVPVATPEVEVAQQPEVEPVADAVPEPATVESSESAQQSEVPAEVSPVKPKAKRGRKPKKVAPAPEPTPAADDETELDVDNLS